jgi:hypothetical protein
MTTAKEDLATVKKLFTTIEGKVKEKDVLEPLKKIRKITESALKEMAEIEEENGVVPDDAEIEVGSEDTEEEAEYTDSDSTYKEENSEEEEEEDEHRHRKPAKPDSGKL